MKYFVTINVKSTLHYYFVMVQVKIYNGKIKKTNLKVWRWKEKQIWHLKFKRNNFEICQLKLL